MAESHFRPGMTDQEVIQLLRTNRDAFQEGIQLWVEAHPEIFDVTEVHDSVTLEQAAEMLGVDLDEL